MHTSFQLSLTDRNVRQYPFYEKCGSERAGQEIKYDSEWVPEGYHPDMYWCSVIQAGSNAA